mgnify:CR=1 FL=1
MKTYIFGKRSFLSKKLLKKINKSEAFSLNEINNFTLKKKLQREKKYNLIINSFYPTGKIGQIKEYSIFFEKTTSELSKMLDSINPKKINKLIYTSSSSIYGSIDKNIFIEDSFNRKLYGTVKLTCERLVQNFSIKNKLNFVISRIFNMYGEGDNISIISKILNTKKNKKKLLINNYGQSIRDFIFVDDVAEIYKKLLKNSYSGIIDIGSGYGVRIKDIIDSLPLNKNKFIYSKRKIIEESFSTANIEILSKIFDTKKLKSLETYLRKKLVFKKKILFQKFYRSSPNTYENILPGTIIYGAGYSGKSLYESMKQNNQNVYCFVDDNKEKVNKKIDNKKIISFDDLIKLNENFVIPNIVVAVSKISYTQKIKLIKKLFSFTLNLSFVSDRKQIIRNQIDISDIRNINLNDLFNRRISKIKNYLIKRLKNKVILITGGAGSIGSELCIQISKINPKKIIIIDHSETALFNLEREMKKISNIKISYVLGDINDTKYLNNIILKYKVEEIYHAAAYKHVAIVEQNILKSVKNNIFGTLSVLKSISKKVQNVTIVSTDKAARPKNVLGYTKRISEIISQNFFKNKNLKNTKLSIVRFGNVFASQGSAIQVFLDQINKGSAITISNFRAKRFFMSIKEACNLVIQVSQMISKKNRITILKMGSPIKIINVINKIINIMGLDKKNVKVIETGLKKSEKLVEKISISKSFYKTEHPDILSVEEPKYKNEDVELLLSNLQNSIFKYNSKKTLFLMRKFLKKER